MSSRIQRHISEVPNICLAAVYETESLKRDFNAHNKQIGILKKVLFFPAWASDYGILLA